MGQHGSKSSIEARVIFQRVGSGDVFQKTDSCLTPVVRIQKRAGFHSPSRSPDRLATHSWGQSRCDEGGLVYVMDNPTGGVWVKPEEKWTRS